MSTSTDSRKPEVQDREAVEREAWCLMLKWDFDITTEIKVGMRVPAGLIDLLLTLRTEREARKLAEAEVERLKAWMTSQANLLSDGECGHLQTATDMVLRRLAKAKARRNYSDG